MKDHGRFGPKSRVWLGLKIFGARGGIDVVQRSLGCSFRGSNRALLAISLWSRGFFRGLTTPERRHYQDARSNDEFAPWYKGHPDLSHPGVILWCGVLSRCTTIIRLLFIFRLTDGKLSLPSRVFLRVLPRGVFAGRNRANGLF